MLCFYIPILVSPLFSPPSLPPNVSPTHSFSISFFKKGKIFHGYQLVTVYQITLWLETTSPIKSGIGSSVGGTGPKSRQKNHRQSLFPLLGVSRKDKVTHCNICELCLGQTHAGSLVVGLVSVSPYEPMLVDSVGFLGGWVGPL